LPTFIKRKHPKKEELKKTRGHGQGPSKQIAQKGRSQGGKGTIKYQNHQSCEAYQLKKGEANLIKLQA
jgi:hypothetical protein